jgi:hypothetical protein
MMVQGSRFKIKITADYVTMNNIILHTLYALWVRRMMMRRCEAAARAVHGLMIYDAMMRRYVAGAPAAQDY